VHGIGYTEEDRPEVHFEPRTFAPPARRPAAIRDSAEFLDGMAIMDSNRQFAPGTEMTRVTLADLSPGDSGVIQGFTLPNESQEALARFGFILDTEVTFVRRAPMGDPIVYAVDGSEVALRAETARGVLVWRLPGGPKPPLA